MPYQSLSPATGDLLKSFAEATGPQLEAKLVGASACFAVWRHNSYAERAKIVTKVAALMLDHQESLARTMTVEMGKRIADARGEVAFSAAILSYYAKNAERFLAPVALHPAKAEAHMESSPIGVIFAVERWNFPYYQLARVAGPHLMAGNVLMVKHAGNVPQCAKAFEALWTEAGAPAGLYTNLLISYDQADAIIDDARVKGVALTGSAGAGAKIVARAGQNLKPSSMELGGKRIPRAASFMEPTILTCITPDNPACREEFFGPVALFFRVKDEAARIVLANDSDFDLGGSVFTKDIARGKRVASQIDTGMMFGNNLDWADADLPFGGVKTSGYGRELGDMGIQQFVNKKLVGISAAEAPAVTAGKASAASVPVGETA